MGGVFLWVAIFPFDVIKSRVQITNTTEPMMKMLLRIARTEGQPSDQSFDQLVPMIIVGVGSRDKLLSRTRE